jgi:hypothetical protein
MAKIYRFINRLHKAKLEKIKDSNIILRIPKNITTEKIASLVPKSYKDQQLFIDKAIILLSYIFIATVEEKKKVAYLHSDFLKAELGDDYKLILKKLESAGMVICKKKYIIGVSSYGYTLGVKHKKLQFREVQLASVAQIRKTKNQRKKIAEVQKALLLNQKELVYALFQKNFQLDVIASLKYLEQLEIKLKAVLKKYSYKSNEEREESIEIVVHTIEQAKNSVKKFNEVQNLKLNIPKVQVRGGRLHTKVSGMMSELRNFLTYNNQEQLVYLDISNSQPYHLMLSLQPEFWSRKKQDTKKLTLKNVDNILYKQLSRKECNEEYNTIIRSLKTLDKSVSTPMITRNSAGPYSAKYFCHLVSTGKLYEFTSKEFEKKLWIAKGLHPLRDRNSAKQAFIQMLYSDSKKKLSTSSKLMRIFKKAFPEVATVIEYLKSRSNRDFAYLLQKIEAEFIINKISLPLMKENHELPIYTIHDGIVTTTEYAEQVRQKINEVYIKEIGVAPNVKVESLNAKKAFDGLKNYTSKKAAKVIADYFKDAELLPPSQQELLKEIVYKLSASSEKETTTEIPANIDFPDYSFLDVS